MWGIAQPRRVFVGVVLLGVLIGAGVLAYHFLTTRQLTESTAPERTVAVLPFESLSSDQDDYYIAVGLQDEIITMLAKIGHLQPISRTSTRRYARSTSSVTTIGEELGVAMILAGTVQRAGDRLKVTAQLIDARTNEHFWAELYERDIAGLQTLPSEIAIAVMEASPTGRRISSLAQIPKAPTSNAEAYDLFLRAGEFDRRAVEEENLQIAEQLYQRALELDPTFAEAHARLAMVHSNFAWYGYDRSPARRELVRLEAKMALLIDPEIPEAHLAMRRYWQLGESASTVPVATSPVP